MDSLKLLRTPWKQDIPSTLEYLKKLFIMPDSPDRFVEFGEHLLDLIHDFFKDQGSIHSSISIDDLRQLFQTLRLPEAPMRMTDVLTQIKHNIIKHSVKVSNPYYIGHMTSAVPYFMILLEMISVSLNQNQVKLETARASSFVEREFLGWMHRLVFNLDDQFYERALQNQQGSLGSITSGGTLGNLTALSVALAKAFPPDGQAFKGIRRSGFAQALRCYGFRQAVVLVSKRSHYSFTKAAAVLGMGSDSVIQIPVEPCRNRIDIEALYSAIDRIRRQDRREGLPTRFVALAGIAGTTETGNVDELDRLAPAARELNAHFHVDAAWGGGALLMKGGRQLMRGIEKADSVTLDAHKLLYTPNAMGICLFRDPDDSRHLYHTANYIIRKGSADLGRFTLEGSRPFACLKPWAAMKIIGARGYEVLFDHAAGLQAHLVRSITADPCFELLNQPELFIVNYRFVPPELHARLNRFMSNPRQQARQITSINHALNELNVQLHRTIRRKDTSFVSRTRLESTRYGARKIVVLRAVTINPLTEPGMLSEILAEHRQLGLGLWEEMRQSLSGDTGKVKGERFRI